MRLPGLNNFRMNVVITGASQGIGRGIAEAFARQGADLFLCARHMDREIHWQQDLMEQFNTSVMSHNADLSDATEVQGFAAKVLEAFTDIDVIVNNAGAFEPGTVHGEPEGQLEKMIRVNLYSAYHLSRALLPRMMARKQGHIFNICSVAALQAYPAGGSYSISKWALLGFSRNLREEMKPYGIKVTAVHPGATMTRSWESSGVAPERIMQVEDIARMVVASASLSPQACVEDILMRPQLGDL
jgi:short-subunit dehydrogenase